MHTGLRYGNLDDGDHVEDLGVDGFILLKCTRKRRNERSRVVFIWIRLGIICGPLKISAS
jgi:hypothetical protein